MSEFPVTISETVDFSKPYSDFEALVAQRRMLQGAERDIRSAMANVSRYELDGIAFANMAAGWAVTLFFCDLLRNSLSAADRRAPILFGEVDRLVENAKKVLKLLGLGSPPSKADVLKSVDSNFQHAIKFTENVKMVRRMLEKAKIRIPKPYNVLTSIAMDMADDTIMIINASQASEQVSASANSAQANMRVSLQRIHQRMMAVDAELSRIMDEAQRRRKIAFRLPLGNPQKS